MSGLAVAVLVAGLCLNCSCSGGDDKKVEDLAADLAVPDSSGEEARIAPEVVAEVQAETVPGETVGEAVVPDEPKRLVILHMNDFHSHLYGFGPEADYTPTTTGDDVTVGGIARLAALIQQEKGKAAQAGADVVVLDCGDFTMGSIFSMLTATAGVELKLLDAMGVQATTLGNHEFDWGPAGAAAIVNAGVQGTAIKILAGNVTTSAEAPEDDAFEAVKAGGAVLDEFVLETPGGLKIGLFGLMGKDAQSDAPFMPPAGVSDPEDAANARVASLEGKGVDLVVAISHGGAVVGAGKGEDEKLAEKVNGLDIIISGHSHTALTEVDGDADTLVVQAGSYGRFLGKLVVDVAADKVTLVSYELLPVDDAVAGDAAILAKVDEFRQQLDTLLAGAGLAYDKVLAEVAFDIVQPELVESPLGNLVTDAILAAVNQLPGDAPKAAAAFEANGVIRDAILAGKAKAITVADAFRVLPLGIGPDQVPGYPIVTFYVKAKELKNACEAAVAIPQMMGDDYFLQFAGLKFTYDPAGPLFNVVKAIYLKEGNAYSATPLDTSDANTQLYRVAVNLYVAAMMGVLESKTGGLLAVTPRDKDGNPITDLKTAILDSDPVAAGTQELKLWQTLVGYLMALPDADADQVPDVPAIYEKAEGRMVKE
jgi:5'-nucleotidase